MVELHRITQNKIYNRGLRTRKLQFTTIQSYPAASEYKAVWQFQAILLLAVQLAGPVLENGVKRSQAELIVL